MTELFSVNIIKINLKSDSDGVYCRYKTKGFVTIIQTNPQNSLRIHHSKKGLT